MPAGKRDLLVAVTAWAGFHAPLLRPPCPAVQSWQDPAESCVAVLGVLLCCYLPRLALPALLAWLVLSTLALQPADFGAPWAPSCSGDALHDSIVLPLIRPGSKGAHSHGCLVPRRPAGCHGARPCRDGARE